MSVNENNIISVVRSDFVLLSYISHYVLQSVTSSFAVSLPPHKLVQIAGELVSMATSHPFKL